MFEDKVEISSVSMSHIEQEFSKFLGETIWVPDWYKAHKTNLSSQSVLLMGFFFRRIFQPDYWPEGVFELYCLSTPVKKILVELFDFDSEHVSVVPRYDLFPSSKSRPFPQLKDAHFVHSGRISPQKNIEFLVFTVFYLQLFCSSDIELTLMGKFDNEYHSHLLNFHYVDYEKKILHLIETLPWPGKKPVIRTEFSSSEWINHLPENSVMISSSTLISEDFSVSIAQAQKTGIPCLLPFWGGFQDVHGSNVQFFSIHSIADSHHDLSDVSLRAKEFASGLIERTNTFNNPNSPQKSFSRPERISREYLFRKIEGNRRKWGKEVDHITNENFPLFVKSDAGKNFFREFVRAFSQS